MTRILKIPVMKKLLFRCRQKLLKKKRTFFYSIDEQIVKDVENGTPESLQKAMTAIRKNETEYTMQEKILIQIATEIMKQLWPSQKITWQSYDVEEENAYSGAISSSKNGIYDFNTGNTDFFTILLPSLVLLNPNAAINQADVLSGYYEASRKALQQAAELNPSSVLPMYLLGVLYERQKMNGEASVCYRQVYEKIPGVQEVYLAYSRTLSASGNLELAYTVLQKNAEGQNANNIQFLKQLAYVAFKQDKILEAEEYVARVLQHVPNDLEFVLFRAKILVKKNDYIHAVSLLDMYARQDNSSIDYLMLRAKVQLDWSKNVSGATETVEKALQLYPNDEEALMMAAKISSITDSPVAGKYADELAAKVLEINPENMDARVYALDGLMQRENWSEAYEISKKIVESGKAGGEVVFAHVKNCIKLNKKSEALSVAEAAYKENPSDENICRTYIFANAQAGQRDAALKIIDDMLATAPQKMKSYLFFQRSYLQLTEDLKLADLRSSLTQNPRNSEALLSLYEIYYDKKDYKKAQYYLRQVVAINPNDTSIRKLNEALTQLMK